MQQFISDNKREGVKLLFETFKHLTTLSTGSILLLATYLKAITLQANYSMLAMTSIGLFFISTMFSVVLMLMAAKILGEDGFRASQAQSIFYRSFCVSALTFILAIFCLVVFIAFNLGKS